MRMAKSAGGKIPEMIPTMTEGKLQIHASQWYVLQSEWMLLTAPMKATVHHHMLLATKYYQESQRKLKRTRECPENDQSDRGAPRNGRPDSCLVGIHVQVTPNDILRFDSDRLTRHPVRFMMCQRLRRQVGSYLSVEKHEGGVQWWVSLGCFSRFESVWMLSVCRSCRSRIRRCVGIV